MDNPPDFTQSVIPSILTDFEDGLSVCSVKPALDQKGRWCGWGRKGAPLTPPLPLTPVIHTLSSVPSPCEIKITNSNIARKIGL